MHEELELPAIWLSRLDVFPSLRVAVLELLESLVIQAVLVSALGNSHEQVSPDHEDEDMAVSEFKIAVRVASASKFSSDLRVLNDVIVAIFLADNTDLFACVTLSASFQCSVQLVLMSEADLDWVKNLVQDVVNTNDLNILEAADSSLDFLVSLDSFKECAISIRCKQ